MQGKVIMCVLYTKLVIRKARKTVCPITTLVKTQQKTVTPSLGVSVCRWDEKTQGELR